MSMRYKGGVISATPPTISTSSATGIWTRQQQMQAQGAGTWPPYIPLDPYFNYVTALLHGDGTNGAQNNTFLDSSTNALSITRNGNTTQGTLSPYAGTGYYSISPANSSTAYLSVATTSGATGPGTGDFTIEGWVYPNNTSILFDARPGGGNWSVNFYGGGSLNLYYGSQVGYGTVPLYQWSHIAITRSSGMVYYFVNGTLAGSVSNTTNLTGSTQCYIGHDNGGGTYLNSEISNFRLVIGTALYTASFTVPTTPLTAVSGTGILTCQSNRFIDNSTNAFAITVSGSPSVQRFSPFSPSAAYSTSVIGGSGYFDGTGDYLLTASNAAFTLAGDFTIEGWMYMTSGSNDISLFTLGDANAATGIQVYYYNSAIRMYSGATIIASSSVPNFNAWIHVAVVRSGTTVTLYLNGVSNGTATKATTYSGAFYTGASNVGPGEYMNGSISDIRVVKGTAVYTTTFTPPTAPLTAITNTSYLLSFTNAGIYDNAEIASYETAGSAQVSTTQVKFGTGSMKFNGTTDYLLARGALNATKFGGNFTIEAWVYPTATAVQTIIDTRTSDGSATGLFFGLNGSNQLLLFTNNTSTTGGTVSLSTWTYVAIARSGSTITLYVNGSSVNTYTSSANFTDANLQIGASTTVTSSSANYLTGYIDDLRITNGYARTITTPTAAFPNQ